MKKVLFKIFLLISFLFCTITGTAFSAGLCPADSGYNNSNIKESLKNCYEVQKKTSGITKISYCVKKNDINTVNIGYMWNKYTSGSIIEYAGTNVQCNPCSKAPVDESYRDIYGRRDSLDALIESHIKHFSGETWNGISGSNFKCFPQPLGSAKMIDNKSLELVCKNSNFAVVSRNTPGDLETSTEMYLVWFYNSLKDQIPPLDKNSTFRNFWTYYDYYEVTDAELFENPDNDITNPFVSRYEIKNGGTYSFYCGIDSIFPNAIDQNTRLSENIKVTELVSDFPDSMDYRYKDETIDQWYKRTHNKYLEYPTISATCPSSNYSAKIYKYNNFDKSEKFIGINSVTDRNIDSVDYIQKIYYTAECISDTGVTAGKVWLEVNIPPQISVKFIDTNTHIIDQALSHNIKLDNKYQINLDDITLDNNSYLNWFSDMNTNCEFRDYQGKFITAYIHRYVWDYDKRQLMSYAQYNSYTDADKSKTVKQFNRYHLYDGSYFVNLFKNPRNGDAALGFKIYCRDYKYNFIRSVSVNFIIETYKPAGSNIDVTDNLTNNNNTINTGITNTTNNNTNVINTTSKLLTFTCIPSYNYISIEKRKSGLPDTMPWSIIFSKDFDIDQTAVYNHTLYPEIDTDYRLTCKSKGILKNMSITDYKYIPDKKPEVKKVDTAMYTIGPNDPVVEFFLNCNTDNKSCKVFINNRTLTECSPVSGTLTNFPDTVAAKREEVHNLDSSKKSWVVKCGDFSMNFGNPYKQSIKVNKFEITPSELSCTGGKVRINYDVSNMAGGKCMITKTNFDGEEDLLLNNSNKLSGTRLYDDIQSTKSINMTCTKDIDGDGQIAGNEETATYVRYATVACRGER